MDRTEKALLGIAIFCIAGVAAAAAIAITAPFRTSQPASPSPRTGTSLPGVYAALQDPNRLGSIFGLTDCSRVVVSAYAYESNLVGGQAPVGDYDCLVTPGAHHPVHLPGNRSDTYVFVGAIYVEGSGWVAEFITPNAGRIALLHLLYLAPGLAPPGATSRPVLGPGPLPNLGYDETALAVGYLLMQAPTGRPRAIVMHGGDYVGLSGWPDWAQFANGSPGPNNAHLCIVFTWEGAVWMWRVATGQDAPPKPRPHFDKATLARWNRDRDRHHMKRISVWWHGKIAWGPSAWLTHQRLGGVRYQAVYHRKGGYSVQGFVCGHIWMWARYHRAKVVYSQCRP